MLTPEENAALDELNGLSTEMAETLQSPWEPACVARAFRTPREGDLVFTMQGWIDLDALRSVLLCGGLPATLDDLRAAAAVFGLDVEALTPEEGADVARAMRRAVEDAFAMSLQMAQPHAEPGAEEPDGFGAWLPLFACLVTQCGLGPEDALALPVGRAYALVAAHRRNQGWRAAGTEYALRELAETEGQNLQNGQNSEERRAAARSVNSVHSVENSGEVS